jgi:hypothetical protein
LIATRASLGLKRRHDRHRVFDVVALPAKPAVLVECSAELAADYGFDCVVPTTSGRAQSLLRKQGCTGEARSVVSEGEGAVRVAVSSVCRSAEGSPGFRQPRHAVGACAGHCLEFAPGEQPRDFSLASLPSRHFDPPADV